MSADEMLQFTSSCNHSLDKTGDWLLSMSIATINIYTILKFADIVVPPYWLVSAHKYYVSYV